MRITRLRLVDVKRHARLDLEFPPGMTVIRGPNEAGKSTVQRAIEVGLFRRTTSTALELESVRSWAKPDADPMVEITFDADGSKGIITKTFAGAKGVARLEVGHEVVTDPVQVDRQLAEITGLPSEKFFRSTACIRHQELADLERDEGALRDRLQQSMSGADRGTWAARRKLTDAIARYKAEGVKNPGPLKQARDEIGRLSAAADAGRLGLDSLERDRSALSLTRSQREATDARMADQQADFDAASLAVDTRDRAVTAETDYARYKRAAELHEDAQRLAATMPTTMPLPDLRTRVEQMRTTEFDLSEVRAELASRSDVGDIDPDMAKPPQWRPWIAVAAVLAVAGAGVAIFDQATTNLVAAAAVGAVAVVVLLVAWYQRRRGAAVRLSNDLRREEIGRLLADRTDLETRVRETQRRRDLALTALQLPDLSSVEGLLTAQVEHESQMNTIHAELRGLLGEVPEAGDDLGRLRDQVAAAAESARHALAGMGDVGTDPDRHRQRADGALRAARMEREAAMTAEATAIGRVQTNTVDAEEVAATQERLEAARELLSARERRARVYELALSTLDAAEAATMKKAARYLEQRMGDDVAAITDGRYRRVTVDETTLTLRVFSPDKDDWVAVEDLSRGTIDQIYLAARLGLVRQVTNDRRPPLIFDDPFVTFDDGRATRAAELLKSLAADFQILYLTTSDRYDAVADAVIELAAPVGRP